MSHENLFWLRILPTINTSAIVSVSIKVLKYHICDSWDCPVWGLELDFDNPCLPTQTILRSFLLFLFVSAQDCRQTKPSASLSDMISRSEFKWMLESLLNLHRTVSLKM